MKKICLLAIGSFFSALAFSQNAVQTVPGQPKPGRSTTPQAATASTTPVVANANGVAKPKASMTTARAATTKNAATKRTISSKTTTPKAEY